MYMYMCKYVYIKVRTYVCEDVFIHKCTHRPTHALADALPGPHILRPIWQHHASSAPGYNSGITLVLYWYNPGIRHTHIIPALC